MFFFHSLRGWREVSEHKSAENSQSFFFFFFLFIRWRFLPSSNEMEGICVCTERVNRHSMMMT